MRPGGAILAAAAGVIATPAQPGAPMSYLEAFGSLGDELADITWGVLILAIVVVAVIAALLAISLAHVRTGIDMSRDRRAVKRADDRVALPWIYSGLALTTAFLIAFVVWTMQTLAAIEDPATEPALTVDVTAHQWWWELAYVGDEPSRSFETANEVHIPVGQPVRFRLHSADVIHSFWVPALGGKTDLIPGQENVAWLQAEEPGVYRGQCAEYCGLQHAHMALRIFADPPDDFAEWWDAQLQDAPVAPTRGAVAGKQTFLRKCSACHTVRGTIAGGKLGPDLTHLMSRSTIAAGTLPNTLGHLSGWIANPQALKPGTTMPKVGLSGPELADIRSYLITLE